MEEETKEVKQGRPKKQEAKPIDTSNLPLNQLSYQDRLRAIADGDSRVYAIIKMKEQRQEAQIQAIGFLAVCEILEKFLSK